MVCSCIDFIWSKYIQKEKDHKLIDVELLESPYVILKKH